MNKRITYLLLTALVAQSTPVFAQTHLHHVTTHANHFTSRTTNSAIDITTKPGLDVDMPTTTGPAISIDMANVIVEVTANSNCTYNNTLYTSNFLNDYVSIGVKLIGTSFKDPKNNGASIASHIISSLNLKTIDTEEAYQKISSIYIYNEHEFLINIKTDKIDIDSITDTLSFTLPQSLLTTTQDVTVSVPIVENALLGGSANVMTGPIYVSDIISSGFEIGVRLKDTAFKEPKYAAGSLHSYILDSLNLKTTDGQEFSGQSNVRINNEAEFVFNMRANNIDATCIPDVLTFTVPGQLLTKGKSLTVSVPVIRKSSVPSGGSSISGNNAPSNAATKQEAQLTPENTTLPVVPNAPVTASHTVEKLIQTQTRQLTTKVTPVNYGLTINNKKVDLQNKLLVSNGRTLVPVRVISEALNLPIQYDANTKTAIIKNGDTVIEMPLGYNIAIVNGQMVQIDSKNPNVMSTIQDNRAYLPIRFIAEQLNLKVNFNNGEVQIHSAQ